MEELLKFLTPQLGAGVVLFAALAIYVIARQQKIIDTMQARLIDRSEKSTQNQQDTAVGLSAIVTALDRMEDQHKDQTALLQLLERRGQGGRR